MIDRDRIPSSPLLTTPDDLTKRKREQFDTKEGVRWRFTCDG